MYDVFDNFLKTGTWHTTHDEDAKRFYNALAKVVTKADFNADKMAEHLRSKVAVTPESEAAFSSAIERLTANAWAVREYLLANEL